ncbi:MAG: 50S ribosomal protein L21 [Cyanobacteria bacterium]|jgi:large subunit ribosomal protein L21|nr:50S ribosomal protein L21 [Cyanobacteriota bacterium]
MFALVDLNGKQYRFEEGRYLDVDLLPQEAEESVELGNVLMIVDGDKTLVGAPFVEGAKVQAKVLSHRRGPKIIIYKMRCKKGYRRKNGHRQDYTRLQIVSLDFPGKKASSK